MTEPHRPDPRFGLLRRLVALPRPSKPARFLVAVSASVAVLVIGLIDYATGPEPSLAVFYLLPVTVGTVTVGAAAGVCLAAGSAIVWVLADALIQKSGTGLVVQAWTGLLRFVILAVVVALLAGFRDATDAARASERRSRDFLAFAAHQLRTPVAGIRASAEVLLAEGGTPAQEQILLNVATESARAGRLLASLLRMARIDQGESVQRRATDVVALCEGELDRIRLHAPHLDVCLETRTPMPTLALDADATLEALANLLDNASRHAVAAIRVRVAAADGLAELTVRDDGPGLPPGAEDHAFERFVSLDGRGGAGLGLSIARSLARARGGELSYRAGVFVLSVPAAPVPADTTLVAKPATGRQSR